MTIDLRHGRYADVLADEKWDALICDPPYSERTHSGMRTLAKGDGSFTAGGETPVTFSGWAPIDARRKSSNVYLGSTASHYKDVIGGIKSAEGGIVGGKGIALMRKIVRDYTRPGWRVCDPTAGAGTTAIACALEGRKFIGSEMDAGRHALALSRIAKHTAQQDMFTVPA